MLATLVLPSLAPGRPVLAQRAPAQADTADDEADNVAGGGGATNEPPAPARPNRGGATGRPHPSTLSITPSLWTGFRHRFSKTFLVDVYAKQKFGIREQPYQTPTTDSSGGVSAAWSVGGFSLSTAFEIKESFKQFYGPWNGTGFDLRAAASRQFAFESGWQVTPAFLVSHLWSNPRSRDRWKIELSAPLGYAIDKKLTWQPVIPTIAFAAYTHRRVGQRDWTFNLSTGARYQLTSATMVGLAAGFEQRQSNVANAAYSRWVLQPKVQVRVAF